MGQEKNAENIPFLRSTQPKSTERVPVVELSGYYSWIRKYKFSSPLPAQDKKRILFYALGRYILTPYLRFRERDKPRKTKDLFD